VPDVSGRRAGHNCQVCHRSTSRNPIASLIAIMCRLDAAFHVVTLRSCGS
jgi:hypothetical protein